MRLMHILLLGSYLAGIVGLVLGVAIRLGLPLMDLSARGALLFSTACFLCSLATRDLEGKLEKPQ